MYCPVDMSVSIQAFFHVIAFQWATPFADAFCMEAIAGGSGVEQDGIVFTCVVPERAPARLIRPDNFIFKPRAFAALMDPKDLIQHDPGVVRDMPVEVYVEAAVLSEQ